jgi:deoxyribonuclease-4
MHLGFHLSVADGLVKTARRAARLKLECLQIFARNARGWRARAYGKEEVTRFRAILDRRGIAPLVVHACYLVNLASPAGGLRERSLRAVADDMERAAVLGDAGPSFVVVHSGHHMGAGTGTGLRMLATSIRALLSGAPARVGLLLENSAGRGSELGGEWSHFARVLDLAGGDERVGVCFDTCHAHAAGYRMGNVRQVARTLAGFRKAVGLSRLRLIHLNDCRGAAGARRDLHQHIGRGTIGDTGFRAFLWRRDLQGRCAILETPMGRRGDDLRNVRHVRELMGQAPR